MMLQTATRAVTKAGVVLPRAAVGAAAARQFSSSPVASATLKELESRVKSVKNIEKITKSMKMIATTRLNKAQNAMKTAKEYGAANSVLFSESEVSKSVEGGKKVLWIVVSSDRGLCGGIHSSVSKKARRTLQEEEGENPTSNIIVLGDKPKQQLSRVVPNNLVLSFNQIGRAVPTFMDACAITEQIEDLKLEYDSVKIVYNRFVSSIAYEASVMEVFNGKTLAASPKFASYEMDSNVDELASFALTNAIYATLVEGHASEICARRNAMDNASKNAGELISKLTMQFNRMRQAAITNELVDIITGASAL